MQALYASSFRTNAKLAEVFKKDLKNHPTENIDFDLTEKIINQYEKNKKNIDKIIVIAAPEWPLNKINPIDLAVLRLSITEILYIEEVPPKVAIDEAVEIAKQFGNENSHRFVNGVLGTIYRQSPRYEKENDKK